MRRDDCTGATSGGEVESTSIADLREPPYGRSQGDGKSSSESESESNAGMASALGGPGLGSTSPHNINDGAGVSSGREETMQRSDVGPGRISTSPPRVMGGAGTNLAVFSKRGVVDGAETGATTQRERQSTKELAFEEM